MGTKDYLEQLEQDREDLVDNLETKGITGLTGDETFTELVPEVLNIPSGGGLDWSAIGYTTMPEGIIAGYNYALEIQNNWDATQTTMRQKFVNDKRLIFMPLVDTSNVTNMYNAFNGCNSLLSIPLLNTNNVKDMSGMFASCFGLETIPLFNTSNVTTMRQMFKYCSTLTNIPLFNTSSLSTNTALQDFVDNVTNLTDTSLDNILQMCINATSYGGTKILTNLGFDATNYPTSRIQALPHYQDFINAGWTIGY